MHMHKNRYEDPQNVIRKKNITPVPAYENWIESQTIQDLQAIRFNHNSIHMESLTIRERILTTKCPDVAHPIVFRGAVCADNGRFDRCESLWLHALELRQNNNVSTGRIVVVYFLIMNAHHSVKINLNSAGIMNPVLIGFGAFRRKCDEKKRLALTYRQMH